METKRFYGSDPEFFITNKDVKTEYGLIPNVIPPASLISDMGVKFTTGKNNKRILLEKEAYKWIEDGSALELNFKTPFSDSGQIYRTTTSAINDVRKFLSNIDLTLKLSESVLGYFDTKEYWENRDESFTDCVRFGCDKDVFPNLYITLGFEEHECEILDASNHSYRYAGGHFHAQNMSSNPNIYVECLEYASIVLDFLVGTTNILFERDNKIKNQELARLKFYGRPGRIRIQNYSDTVNGIEYRPPSNQWILNPYHVNSIVNSINIATEIIETGKAQDFFNNFKDRIFDMWDALTKHDKDIAKDLLSDSLIWLLDNNMTTLKDLEGVYGKL